MYGRDAFCRETGENKSGSGTNVWRPDPRAVEVPYAADARRRSIDVDLCPHCVEAGSIREASLKNAFREATLPFAQAERCGERGVEIRREARMGGRFDLKGARTSFCMDGHGFPSS